MFRSQRLGYMVRGLALGQVLYTVRGLADGHICKYMVQGLLDGRCLGLGFRASNVISKAGRLASLKY